MMIPNCGWYLKPFLPGVLLCAMLALHGQSCCAGQGLGGSQMIQGTAPRALDGNLNITACGQLAAALATTNVCQIHLQGVSKNPLNWPRFQA
ncbi:hypothetical protein LHGZ1_1338 [Laribacter hongkongensis]|uniref:Uncharacterized protein n=1 Tax=Laribacter hongkongensis TaxID=168471 RepID=A0A248LI51_9NEIS|nr:hypothetical protein LHGZ1_1338 [Laribacter hongkongensis]